MRLVKCNLNEVKVRTYSAGKNQQIIEEFMNSNMDCAEVTGFPQKDAHSCANSLATSIKRFKYHGVKAASRKDKVYLIKVKDE